MSLQNVFLRIVRLSLWEDPFDEHTLASVLEEDFEEMFKIAQLQGLAAIFVDGLAKLTNSHPECKKFLERIGPVTIIESELRWQTQLQIARKLSDIYKQHGIDTLLLKGLGLSLYYPNPKLRECNDIDIYLFGRYEEGNQLASRFFGAKIEKFSVKEEHIFIDNVTIDNHIHFVWPGSKNNIRLDSYMIDSLAKENLSKFPESNILLPSLEFNYLFLLAHAYGHFMREGICLRQITDIACLLKYSQKDFNWDKVNRILLEFHLSKLSDAILSYIKKYFNLSFGQPASVEHNILERMHNDIFGNMHMVIYHKSRLAERLYLIKVMWKRRWFYNAFFDGGFRQLILNKIINNIHYFGGAKRFVGY